MASWVDLSSIHNPAPGRRPPAAWGDGVVSDLELLRSTAAAEVLTSQSTTSTSFVDLATAGPAVSIDTGASALVVLSSLIQGSGAAVIGIMGVAVSGATTIAASADNAVANQAYAASALVQVSALCLFTGLNPGVNVFTAKYLTSSGTSTFQRRRMAVIPLF